MITHHLYELNNFTHQLIRLGKIETEMCGTVELEVGSMHYLPRGDVEPFIRSGALVQLSGEESF